MTNNQSPRYKQKFDLEDRTLSFAKEVINMLKTLPNNTPNSEIIRQLVRSVGSVGANYREANDSLGKKDFVHRLRISRKESKETQFWLELLLEVNPGNPQIAKLISEGKEIRNILSAIISKVVTK